MKILLVCSAGMSTDILRGELIKYAKKEQLPLEVKAVGVHAYKEYCTGRFPHSAAIFSLRYAICGPRRITSYPVQYSL